jgi:AbiV family abortive infection protein
MIRRESRDCKWSYKSYKYFIGWVQLLAQVERSYRSAAAAALTNASNLLADAKLLQEHSRLPRATALAILGTEKCSKAIAYALGGIHHGNETLQTNLLTRHTVKYLLAASIEGADIVTNENAEVWPSSKERVINIFIELASTPLSDATAEEYARSHRSLPILTGSQIKNAAFYVSLNAAGEIELPERINKWASFEIIGLEALVETFNPLQNILLDEPALSEFSEIIRSKIRR